MSFTLHQYFTVRKERRGGVQLTEIHNQAQKSPKECVKRNRRGTKAWEWEDEADAKSGGIKTLCILFFVLIFLLQAAGHTHTHTHVRAPGLCY